MVQLKKPILSIEEQRQTTVDELDGIEELSASSFGGRGFTKPPRVLSATISRSWMSRFWNLIHRVLVELPAAASVEDLEALLSQRVKNAV